ncbi:MAG: hypothetical protein Q9223_003078 [Gallowayella weberi]
MGGSPKVLLHIMIQIVDSTKAPIINMQKQAPVVEEVDEEDGIRGRGGGTFTGNYNGNEDGQHHRNELVKIVVKGVLETDLVNDGDSGLAKCREWLEEKARQGSKRPIEYVYLLSPRWEGDDMVFQVKKSDEWRILRSNGQLFRNVVMSVQRADYQSTDSRRHQSFELDSSKTAVFMAVLTDRYDAANKLLRLDRLGDDLRLQEIGTWDPSAMRPKRTDFFQGLMRLCESESVFANRAVKAEKVQSISLANNDLTTMAPVVELAKAFPDIRNLDLSNNRLGSLKALEPFRSKFKNLEWLILSPNPIAPNPMDVTTHAGTILKWFPSLRTLNNEEVEIAAATLDSGSEVGLPFPTTKDNFHDEAGIAESAIRDLILGTDHDRAGLVRKLYDGDSTFSISFNPSAPRLETAHAVSWEVHLKQSRNLKKATQLTPRIQRLARGIEKIEEVFKLLPPTRHPDLVGESARYSFDCTPLPGVPDPHNRSASGVGGFKVDVHGSFDELNTTTGLKNATRSFDRVFILGPGKGQQPLRIISDILILRAEGGHQAFNPDTHPSRNAAVPVENGVQGVGFPAATSGQQVALAGEVSKATGLTMEWATTLLNDSGWDFHVALENFKAAKV